MPPLAVAFAVAAGALAVTGLVAIWDDDVDAAFARWVAWVLAPPLLFLVAEVVARRGRSPVRTIVVGTLTLLYGLWFFVTARDEYNAREGLFVLPMPFLALVAIGVAFAAFSVVGRARGRGVAS